MKTNIIYLCLALLLCGSCSKTPDMQPEPDTPEEPDTPVTPDIPTTYIEPLRIDIEPQEKIWVASGNNFAVDLLAKAIGEAAEKENVMLSPLSLQLALGMLANGVTETAFAEIAAATGFDNGTIGAMNNYYHKLSAALTESELDVELALANSIWIQDGFEVKDAFIQTNKDVYNAEVGNVDFADPATRDLINSWCDQHTRGTIKEIPLELTPLTRLILANAAYFKAAWSMPFEVEDTEPGVFTTSKGEKQTVDMMKMETPLRYASNEHYQAVELPYGNGSFSMIILLPSEENSTDELLATLDWDKLGLDIYRVELSLPKFKTRCHTELNDLLQAMGIREIFTNGALAGISDAGLWVNRIFQDMYLKVNETGTEAAAVTVIEMATSPGPPTETGVNVMHVDRPFVFAIRENSSGVILFTGKIGKIEE